MLGNVVGAETCVWFRCNRASEHATFAFIRECAAPIDSFFWWRNCFFHSQATNDAIYSLLAYRCNERTRSRVGIHKLFETENWIQRLCDRELSEKSFKFNNKFVQYRKMKIKQSPRGKISGSLSHAISLAPITPWINFKKHFGKLLSCNLIVLSVNPK